MGQRGITFAGPIAKRGYINTWASANLTPQHPRYSSDIFLCKPYLRYWKCCLHSFRHSLSSHRCNTFLRLLLLLLPEPISSPAHLDPCREMSCSPCPGMDVRWTLRSLAFLSKVAHGLTTVILSLHYLDADNSSPVRCHGK